VRAAAGDVGDRIADLVASQRSDLAGTGTLSTAQEGLLRRISTLEVELVRLEGMLSTATTCRQPPT
jgi:hypothetical protein